MTDTPAPAPDSAVPATDAAKSMDHMIPKARLDEEVGKRRALESIKAAQCELALRLLSEDLTEDDGNKGVRVVEAGSVRLEYDGRAPAKTLPDTVRALLKPFLRPEEGSSARLVF